MVTGRALLAATLLLVVVAAAAVVDRGGTDGTAEGAADGAADGPVSLVGRLDDATGRSSTVAPGRLDRQWAVELASGDGPVAVPVAAVGDDAVAVGDRVIALADGRVLAGTADLGATTSPLTADGLAGVVEPGAVVLVTRLGRRIQERIEIAGESPRGPRGGRTTQLVGWAGDTAVLRSWDVGLGSSTSRGIDRGSGSVVWETFVDAYVPVGEGWFLGVAARGQVLVDGRTGRLVAVPEQVAEGMVGVPVVAGGTAHAAVDGEIVAWDPTTGAVVSTVDRAVMERLVAEASPALSRQQVAWVELAGGRTTTTTFPGVVALPGVLIVATADGLRGLDAEGVWSTEVPGLVGVAAAPEAGVVVALVRGPAASAAASDGTYEAVVLDGDGTEVARAAVGPVRRPGPATIVAVVGDEVVLGLPDTVGRQVVVSTAEQALVPVEDALAAWTGVTDVAGATVLGTVVGAPGGGVGPVVWRSDPGTLVTQGGDLPLVDGGERVVGSAVLAAGHVAVPTATGMTITPLPDPGGGRLVDDEVQLAVGAQRPTTRVASDLTDRRRSVADLTPVAAAGGLLLAVPGSSTGLRAVDPATGAVLWASDVPFVAPSRASGARARVLAADDTIGVVHGTQVTVLDAGNGTTRWSAELGGTAAGGVLVGDLVVVALPTTVVGLDLGTGRERWRRDVDALATAITAAGTTTFVGTARGVVVVVGRDGAVTELVGIGSGPVDDLAVVDGSLLVVGADGRVVALGTPSGEVQERDRVELP